MLSWLISLLKGLSVVALVAVLSLAVVWLIRTYTPLIGINQPHHQMIVFGTIVFIMLGLLAWFTGSFKRGKADDC